jgi:hypothetical protein
LPRSHTLALARSAPLFRPLSPVGRPPTELACAPTTSRKGCRERRRDARSQRQGDDRARPRSGRASWRAKQTPPSAKPSAPKRTRARLERSQGKREPTRPQPRRRQPIPNLARAARLGAQLDRVHVATIDLLMHHGFSQSIGGKVADFYGHIIDQIPRGAAFLHEARREGFKTPQQIAHLIDRARTDEAAFHKLDLIARKANDALIDYDRMSNFEKDVIRQVIFFYPWVRGATRYTARFALEHPYQALNAAGLGQHGEPAGLQASCRAQGRTSRRFDSRSGCKKPAEDRAQSIYPRTNTQEEIRLGLGAMTPKSYNEEEAQRRALESLPTLQRELKLLIQDSHDVGMGNPPPQVLEDLKWVVRLDSQLKGAKTYSERWKALAKVWAERYGDHQFEHIQIRTEGEAKAAFHQLRPEFYPNYAQWHRVVNQAVDQRLEAQPAAVG